MSLSDEKIALLREAFPTCVPEGRPTDDTIATAEQMQKDGTFFNSDRAARVSLPIPEVAS